MADKFPEGWKLLPLEDCMVAIIDYRGITPKKSAFGVPLVTAKIVKGGRLLDVNEYIPVEDYDDWMRRGLPEPGDVVMTTEAPLGEIAQLDTRKVALAQRLITLRGKPEYLDNNFLKFLMMSDFIQNQLKARSTGTTVLGIKQSELRKVTLVIPPLYEQRAIAHILETLDKKIEINKQINQTLKTMARAFFKAWFIESSSIEGWEVKTIGEVVTVVGGSTPSTSEPGYWQNGTVYWATPKDLSALESPILLDTERCITDLGLQQISSGLLPSGTVLLSSRAPIGYLAITQVPVAINQGFIAIKSTEQIPNYYILHWAEENMEAIKGRANGTTFLEISKANFRPMPIVIPPAQLMRAFVEQVDPLYQRITVNLREIRLAALLRDTLLPKLLSGELQIVDAKQFLETRV